MFKNEFYISTLIIGHFRGDLNVVQEKELEVWLKSSPANQVRFDELTNEDFLPAKLKIIDEISETAIWNKVNKKIIHKLWSRIVAAAAVILITLGAGLWFYTSRHPDAGQDPGHIIYTNDIKPGGNKATLTLANGKKIVLSNVANGELVKQSGINITKTKDGQLVYSVTAKNNAAVEYNTTETPKGGQYLVNLSDGTKIWLNAASSLKYPTQFKSKNRIVELTGEAYFEVAHNKDKPFKVISRGQEVEVLGTHFNINAYTDGPATKTTLIEGSVRVSGRHTESNPEFSSGPASRNKKAAMSNDDVILKPGQQSILNTNNIKVVQVQAEDAIAWKNGYFMFNNDNLENIMTQIARWYNVQVEFEDPGLKKELFFGTVSRYENVSRVLKLLKRTDVVRFEIEGNIIKVRRK